MVGKLKFHVLLKVASVNTKADRIGTEMTKNVNSPWH